MTPRKITLFLYPGLVQIEHYGIGTFVGIADICHESWIDWIASVAASGVVEIDDIEFRLDFVMLSVLEQMVVGYLRKVRKLVVIDIHGKGFLNLLFDVVVHHGIALSGARCSQHDRGSERVYDIDPAVPFLALIDKFRGQVDGILVSISLVSCMKLSLAVLNTSSMRLCFSIRLIHIPDMSRRM